MFKKVTIATAFSTAILLGGAFQAVDASASFNPSQSKDDVSQEKGSHGSGEQVNRETFQDFLDRFFQSNNDDWNGNEKQESNEQNNDKEEVEKQERPGKAQNDANNQSEKTEEPKDTSADGQLNEFEKEVVSLTNEEREKNGLEPLEADSDLSVVARDKSKDMRSESYFSHESPTYGSPFDMMESYDIDYSTAGENIARGQRSPEEVVNGWMNSQGHRENILNPNYTHIGVGFVEEGNYWTQEFTG